MKNLTGRLLTLLIGLGLGASMFSMSNIPTTEENKLAGEAFLAANATKPNIVTTASGLQYEILVKGEGASPSSSARVTVHYRGMSIDGDEFDSSYSRNTPTDFPLNQVILGWTEGVQLMNVGAKYRFFIPSKLAYGEQGAGSSIGPGSTLIFEIELLKF